MDNNDSTQPQGDNSQVVADQSATDTQTEQPEAVDFWDEKFNVTDGVSPTEQPAAKNAEPGKTVTDPQSNNTDYTELYAKQLDGETDKQLDNPILLKHKGKVIDISSAKELRDLAERGLGATSKYQEMAEQRKMLDGITSEDIDMLRKFKAGDQTVLNELATPRESNQENEIDTVAQTILDSNYANEFKGLVGNLSATDKTLISTDPRVLRGLQIDFESGTAQKLLPLVERYMAVKGLPFLEAYTTAGKEMFSGDREKAGAKLVSQPSATSSVTTTPEQDPWAMDESSFKKIMSRGR
ncbi:MAG: hypothetical protein DRQ78_08305 [Epsilonproteobacteria bacterium]|nr:MAG: hypothetical protein DRQ78_08305 [Campylobacterota bacterium]